MDEKIEFFKLDEIDRKVLFWLIDRVSPRSVEGWIEYIAGDYKRRKQIIIDVKELLREIQGKDI